MKRDCAKEALIIYNRCMIRAMEEKRAKDMQILERIEAGAGSDVASSALG